MRFQVRVFGVVMLYGVVVGYQCFRYPFCFHLQAEDGGIHREELFLAS
jgi:hypothetical protein